MATEEQGVPQEQKLDRFDAFLPAEPWVNPWQPDGSYKADLELLVRVLSAAAGTAQQSGIVAAAADVWAAEELRRAGFEEDEVWPRRVQPRVLPRDVRNFVEGGALTKKLRAEVESRYTRPAARRALPAEAHVLGAAYTKQADVVVASWAAGVELLISTKSMLSSYQKNLRNRFEEGYGDAKNLRGRHPLAALGFLFIIGDDIPDAGLDFAIDMLRKLVREPDVYDCACLLVVEGAQAVEEEAQDERGPEEEPAALVPMHEADQEDDAGEEQNAGEEQEEAGAGTPVVTLAEDKVPADLTPSSFFATLIRAALDRMPVAMYPEARRLIREASTVPPDQSRSR